ncbi:hypothetical protein [Halovivax gelatinilyticus]|uniref:hypothetical protein n=1 Tax=Halovivax gelatinilyticus TaxID=2961597 RepID=UPI0020CA74D9|nr:hypothetical protein [Halovivax gelatinilyticus]
MTIRCLNCGKTESLSRCHVHLDGNQVVEGDLCRACHERFDRAEWATVVDRA